MQRLYKQYDRVFDSKELKEGRPFEKWLENRKEGEFEIWHMAKRFHEESKCGDNKIKWYMVTIRPKPD